MGLPVWSRARDNRGTARRTGAAPGHAGGTYPGTHRRIAPAGGLMGERMTVARANETNQGDWSGVSEGDHSGTGLRRVRIEYSAK